MGKLVTTKNMFALANKNGYAIGAFNTNNMEQTQAIIQAAQETCSPVIIQAGRGGRDYATPIFIFKMVEAAIKNADVPVCLHLDHGRSYDICKAAVDEGFTSIMYDGSDLPFEKNIEETLKIVEYAHANNVVVEAELGALQGIGEGATYTDPVMAADFIKHTKVDSLAIAIGTKHGAYKFSKSCALRFDILQQIMKLTHDFPLVLHGASSVMPKYVEQINKYGGGIVGACGVDEDSLVLAAKTSVCKINIDSDLRLAFVAATRKYLFENPQDFDPRSFLGEARTLMKECIKHKMKNVLCSAGHAYDK